MDLKKKEIFYYRRPIIYLILMWKHIKICKKWIKRLKAIRQDLKIKKSSKNIFLLLSYGLKTTCFYSILGDLRFFPIRKITDLRICSKRLFHSHLFSINCWFHIWDISSNQKKNDLGMCWGVYHEPSQLPDYE